MANEIQRFYWGSESSPIASADIEEGTFTLGLTDGIDTIYTDEIAFNATAATIEAELEAIAPIGSGNVSVTLETNGFTVEFIGSLANTNIDLLEFVEGSTPLKKKADTVSVSIIAYGADGVYEAHAISLGGATTGTFDIIVGATSATVSTLDTSGIQSAYDTMFGSGAFTVVDQGSGNFSATANSYGPIDEPSILINATDGSPTASRTTTGVSPESPSFQVWLEDGVDEGDFTVTFNTYYPTTDISWDAFDSAVASAAGTALSKTVGSYSGTGTAGDPWYVAFSDGFSLFDAYGSESGTSSLRAPCSGEIVVVQEGSGGGTTAGVPVGTISFSGVAPSSLANIPVPAGTMTLTGLAPVAGGAAAVPAATITITGVSPGTLMSGSVPAGSLSLTGVVPAVDRSASVPAGDFTLTGLAPSLAASASVPAGSLTLTGIVPSVAASANVPAGSFTMTGIAPAINLVAPVAVGEILLTGVVPTGAITASVPAGTITLSGDSGTVAISALVVVGSFTLTGLAPTIGDSVSVPAGAITFSGGELSSAQAIAVAVGTVTFTGLAPAVLASGDVPVGAITFTGVAPTGAMTADVATGSVNFTGLAPDTQSAQTADVPVGQITLTGNAPGTAQVAAIPSGLMTLSGLEPAVLIAAPVAVGEIAFSGLAPATAMSAAVPAGLITFDGPEVTAGGIPVIADNRVRLVVGGTVQTADLKKAEEWPSSDERLVYEFDGADLGSITAADVNGSGFGAAVSAIESGGVLGTASIDHIRITVHYA